MFGLHSFHLSSYENGHCHTYDPPHKTSPEITNRLYFMLAKITQNYRDYDIFIHERGQFWPRSDMFSFGQSEPVALLAGRELEIVFEIKEVTHLNREHRRCMEDKDYSFTKCLQQYASDKSDCHVDFFVTNGQQEEHCSMENFKKYFDLLIWIKQSKISEVERSSGCYPKCRIVQYSFETTERNIDWTSNWTSEVYVQPKSSFVEYSSEYLSFSSDDLLSSVGGNLGLFLGWSLLTIIEAFSLIVCVCKNTNMKDHSKSKTTFRPGHV